MEQTYSDRSLKSDREGTDKGDAFRETGEKACPLGIVEPIHIVHLVIEPPPLEDSFLLVVFISARGTISGQADTVGAEVSEKCWGI